MRAVCALVCVAAIAGAVPPARAAVTDYLGKPVTSVRLVVEGRDTSEPALTDLVETQIGRPLSMADVRESITHLFSLGRFDDVRVDAALTVAGVALTYELSPVHPVAKIAFAGNTGAPGVDVGELRRVVVERYGASPPVGRATELARVAVEALRERGYLHARVSPRAELSHDPDRATLVFTVDPGSRTLIGAIEVTGAPEVSRAALLNELRIAPGMPYEPNAVNARIERYIEGRRARGYYEAKVTPAVELADDDRVANITLTVDQGLHVRVTFAGDPLPADRRPGLVPIEREGSADEDLLEDSSARIEEFLRAQGFRNAAAPHTREVADGELLITFNVKRGPQYFVSSIEVSGNASMPLAELEPSLRLRAGQPFNEARLDADVATIEDAYRRTGFAGAKAEAAVVPQREEGTAPVPVLVRIVVREGVRTMVGSVRFAGNRSVDEATLGRTVALQPESPFVVARIAAARDAIELLYANRGFANARVEPRPEIARDGTRADVLFTITEGPQIFVDHVLIVGNVRTSTATIERELKIKSGDPLGREAVFESQRRLSTLGLFRRATITEVRHGDETKRDVLVTVEEAPATTVGYGGGGEGRLRVVRQEQGGGIAAERFEVAPRAFFEIGRRNLFGKNRSVSAFTSISVHPKDSPVFGGETSSADTGYGLAEYRIIGTYREPRVLNTAADAFVNATVEQRIRSSFNFRRRSASGEVARRLTPTLSASGGYQIQRTEVFNVNVEPAERPLIDRTFTQVRLSLFSASLIRDTRDDQVDPGSGEYVSANGQFAGRLIGSEVGFAKSFFTATAYRTLPHTRRIVFAGNARFGFAAGFPREATDEVGNPVIVRDLPQAERFYAGGDTTVRGFALDTLGVRHVPPRGDDTIDKDGFPKGGNGLVIFNGELRVPAGTAVGFVGFLDTGNVFARVTNIDLGALRSAAGFGVRYKSPVGPIRIDLGFKLNRRENEGLTAWFITFGQAF